MGGSWPTLLPVQGTRSQGNPNVSGPKRCCNGCSQSTNGEGKDTMGADRSALSLLKGQLHRVSESPKEAVRDTVKQIWVQILFQPVPSWTMSGKWFNLTFLICEPKAQIPVWWWRWNECVKHARDSKRLLNEFPLLERRKTPSPL